ncbi:MAG: hypothetical protein GY727_10855 [Gammaproteobacteria bacterium]|nr:hypothetical protein [Gammaproteobacteria bacterium]
MPKTIFYSWQSDLPNNINRGFILDCLERAVRSIADNNLSLEFDVDRDTLDVSGSPDIVATIFSKIDDATVFIADTTIVTGGDGQRKSPNPNVLVELGYAANQHSWDNIICIFNLALGKIEELPFDLRSRRIVTYELAPNPSDKSTARKELVAKLATAIKAIHEDIPRLARKLTNTFQVINPLLLEAIRGGHRQVSVNLNNRNEELVLELLTKTSLSSLIEITSNGNWLSNNTNSTGGINDVGTGTLSGYNLKISDQLAKMLA